MKHETAQGKKKNIKKAKKEERKMFGREVWSRKKKKARSRFFLYMQAKYRHTKGRDTYIAKNRINRHAVHPMKDQRCF
mgnify:CR=1 FL=1